MTAERLRPLPRKLAVLCLLVGLAAAVTVACLPDDGQDDPPPTPVAPSDGELTVRAFEWGFEPEAIVLQRGQEVRIVFRNEGTILHDFKIEDALTADVIASEGTGPLTADEGELFVGAEDGEEGTLVFVPKAVGTYVFYCTIGNHRQLGMEGTVIVE